MSFIFDLADLIDNIYNLQTVYFTTTKELLIEIKQNYFNIIQNYEEHTLAFECIDNDILTVQLLISEDLTNPFSQKYFSNYYTFKKFYKLLNSKKKDILEPKINYIEEIDFYTNNLNVLFIEIKLYEIYNFRMFLFYLYNQSDIWVLLFKTNQKFTSLIFEKSTNIITHYDRFKKKIDDPKYTKYQNNINGNTFYIVPSKIDKTSTEITWVLEDEDGKKIIQKNDKNGLKFQIVYIDYIKKSVNAFNAIILYLYLLEKYCLLQSRVYISEANIIQINIELEKSLNDYYRYILDDIDTKPTKKMFIPSSILWKSDEFKDKKIIEEKIKQKDKKLFIYFNRLRSIEKSRKKILLYSQDIYKEITPNISKNAFITQCNKMINKEETIIAPYSLGNTIDIIYDDIKNYDIDKINDFNYNMKKLVNELYIDRLIGENDENSYFDWMVYKNDDNIFYYALADGLNRQLELKEETTSNKYTEKINGKRIFTANSLNKIIEEIQIPSITNTIMILENILGIKFIIFEMFERDKNTDINIGDIVLYKNFYYRVIKINDTNPKTYNLYDGLNTLEDVEEDVEEEVEVEVKDENNIKKKQMVKKRFIIDKNTAKNVLHLMLMILINMTIICIFLLHIMTKK